nr:TAB2-1 protein [Altica viridicyanea]
MYAGNKRRSSNVRVMQLFHELKQQFPTIPDHVVTSCITSCIQSNSQEEKNIVKLLETALLAENNTTGQMGRSAKQPESTPSTNLAQSCPEISTENEMNKSEPSVSDDNLPNRIVARRPNHLDIKPRQLSEKCNKLLNSELPPRSPLSSKRLASKNSPSCSTNSDLIKKELCSTPTQTTDTLLNSNPNLGLSLNVNCSVDVLQSPTQQRRTSTLQLTPVQPWVQTPTSPSPRSFTSVNLTLRPPGSTPQDPIDITSQNSSLTYSTTTFDSQKGLQSRLQITVGPGNGSVSALRVRPKSYHPQDQQQEQQMVPVRAGSLNNLPVFSDSPVILKQQARIEKLRIELNTEKAKLVIMKDEIKELEKNRLESEIHIELEKQLLKEIKHLRYQCKDLELDGEAFYNNIYTGQVINEFPTPPPRFRQQYRRRTDYQPESVPPDYEGPKWNCDLCTFLNHPILDKCEQCEFPRILHVSVSPGDNIHIHVTPRLTRRITHSWVL